MAQGSSISVRSGPPKRKRLGGRDAGQRIFVAVTLIPTILGLLIFWIYPLVNGLVGSFTDWQAFQSDRSWAGLDNYRQLWDDDIFRESLVNTFQYAAMYLPLNVIIG